MLDILTIFVHVFYFCVCPNSTKLCIAFTQEFILMSYILYEKTTKLYVQIYVYKYLVMEFKKVIKNYYS
jgi:hypothetical protein